MGSVWVISSSTYCLLHLLQSSALLTSFHKVLSRRSYRALPLLLLLLSFPFLSRLDSRLSARGTVPVRFVLWNIAVPSAVTSCLVQFSSVLRRTYSSSVESVYLDVDVVVTVHPIVHPSNPLLKGSCLFVFRVFNTTTTATPIQRT